MSLEKQPVYSRLHEFKVNRKQVFSLLFVTALLLSSLVVLVKTPTAQASSIFEDGFETGDFTVVVVEEPEPTPTPIVIFDTTTFYFRSDNYQYNTSLMGYGLDLTNTNLQLTISDTATSSISYGFRVWLLRSSGRIVELTSGAPVAIVSRTSEGSGYQSATWTVPSTLTVLGMDRLLITISAEVDDSGSWITRATYLSNKLMTKQILSATWNFTLYTSLADSTGSFRFGSGTYESKIEGVGFKVPVEQEVALFYAGQGDFVGAVLHPFIFWIGNLFYGLALLFAAGTVYLRYKKFEPVLILVILFGGGGSLGFLIPDVAYRLYYFLLLFVIAVVFWRVFK